MLMSSIFGIWLKILNIQLSINLCQYIWKHTNRMPDTGPGSRVRMLDTGCRMYGNRPLHPVFHCQTHSNPPPPPPPPASETATIAFLFQNQAIGQVKV